MDKYASMIPSTNIVYGTSQLQGAKTSYNESDTIKLVFKSDGNSITNIRDSTLNFRFKIGVPTTAYGPGYCVNNGSVANLF